MQNSVFITNTLEWITSYYPQQVEIVSAKNLVWNRKEPLLACARLVVMRLICVFSCSSRPDGRRLRALAPFFMGSAQARLRLNRRSQVGFLFELFFRIRPNCGQKKKSKSKNYEAFLKSKNVKMIQWANKSPFLGEKW